MKKLSLLPLTILTVLAQGCMAAVGTSGAISVPADSQNQCATHCAGIGMELGAVAIMANNVGCVCAPKQAASSGASASITAGMATIAMQEAEQQRQQQLQQQQRKH